MTLLPLSSKSLERFLLLQKISVLIFNMCLSLLKSTTLALKMCAIGEYRFVNCLSFLGFHWKLLGPFPMYLCSQLTQPTIMAPTFPFHSMHELSGRLTGHILACGGWQQAPKWDASGIHWNHFHRMMEFVPVVLYLLIYSQ